MDKIVKICLGIFIVILVAFAGTITWSEYAKTAYRNTLTGSSSYTCTITTDAPLDNVTLFLPVPVDTTGNSPVVSAFSSGAVNGVPQDWDTTLFDTGKSTLLKVMTPAIIPPPGTTSSHPYTITLTSATVSKTPVDTRNPVEKSALFRPVQALTETTCPQERAGGSTRCFTYTTSIYADYTATADATVTIISAVTGKNSWTIVESHSNEYSSEVTLSMKGTQKGWAVMDGRLSSGEGTYDIPAGA